MSLSHPSTGLITQDQQEPFKLLLPSDPEFAQHMFATYQRIAEKLSADGWTFKREDGPRGIYFDITGPAGIRIMSEQDPCPQRALIHAIDVATRRKWEGK